MLFRNLKEDGITLAQAHISAPSVIIETSHPTDQNYKQIGRNVDEEWISRLTAL